jgi:hypothetical protein
MKWHWTRSFSEFIIHRRFAVASKSSAAVTHPRVKYSTSLFTQHIMTQENLEPNSLM